MNERFDDNIKEQIRMRADIAAVVGRYVTLKGSGRSMKGLCPFHKEKTPSFHVNADSGMYYCFGCNKGGDVFNFLQEIERVDFAEALRMLADETGIKLEPRNRTRNEGTSAESSKSLSKSEAFEIHTLAARYYYSLVKNTPVAIEYFKTRGVSPQIVKEFSLGYAPAGWSGLIDFLQSKNIAPQKIADCGLAVKREGGGFYDRFRDRVMFPLCDQGGRVVAFAGRGLNADTQPKYLNSPETLLYQKSSLLYGLHKSRGAIRDSGEILIVEGYMDYLTLYQAGICNAAATSGTAFTTEHAALIQRLTSKVTLVFDGDRAGVEAAHKAIIVLAPFNLEVKVLTLSGDDDPDTFVKREGARPFLQMLTNAKNSTDFIVDKLISEYGSTPQAKRTVIEQLAPYVDALKDPIVRDDFLSKLAQKLRVDERHVFTRFSNRRSRIVADVPVASRLPAAKIGGLEESFLHILLTCPEQIPLAKKFVDTQTLTDSLSANIYSIIVECYEAKGSLDGLCGALPDDTEIKRVISMLMVKPALTENIHAELEQKILLLRRKSLKTELRELRDKLSGGLTEEQKLALMERHKECTAKLKELDE